MTRAAIALSLSLSMTLAASCQPKAQRPSAHLAALQGDVTIHDPDEQVRRAENQDALFENDTVHTGQNGAAQVAFEGGTTVDLGANASLLIQRHGGTQAQFGAVLLSGAVHARSSGKGAGRLVIGTPFGLTELGGQEVSVSLSTDEGVEVLVGRIEMAGHGKKVEITQGHAMTLAGLVIPIDEDRRGVGDAPVAEIIPTVLLATSSQVEFRKPGGAWERPKKRQVLSTGDQVRTQGAKRTLVRFGDAGDLTLDARSQITIQAAQKTSDANAQTLTARYHLEQGHAEVQMNRHPDFHVRHVVKAADQEIVVEPGLEASNVDLYVNGKTATVESRRGVATIDNGVVVEAGERATLAAGKLQGAVRPVSATNVGVSGQAHAVVQFEGQIPAVKLRWPEDEKAGAEAEYVLTIAKDKEFKELLLQERLTKSEFVYDQFTAGSFFWRAKSQNAEVQGSLQIQPAAQEICEDCARENIVEHSPTRVVFQDTLPAIQLRWETEAGASFYVVKLFDDRNLDVAKVDEKVTEARLSLRAGTLAEGNYSWFVQTLDAQGNELRAGKIHFLSLEYDNTVSQLVIRSPKSGLTTSQERLQTFGDVRLGSRLYINTDRVTVDPQGHFSFNLTLALGHNEVVYRTVADDGIERFYIRHIYRN